MTIRHNGLVQQLIKIQEAHRWKDGEMAERLNISRPFWVRIKNGERNPGLVFLRGALSAFPELSDDALEYLQENQSAPNRGSLPPGHGGALCDEEGNSEVSTG